MTFDPPIIAPKSAAVNGWVEYITFPSVRIIVGLFCKLGILDRFVGIVVEAGGRIEELAWSGDDFPAPGVPDVMILYGDDGERSLP